MLKTFAYHKPSQKGLDKIARLREGYSALLTLIEEVDPDPSREKSLALTNLETSAMYAVKAVVFHDPESEVTL